MNICKFIFVVAVTILCGNLVTTNAIAANLMDVYKKALANDPKFKAARAQWLADRETLPIKKADLFPTLKASGNISRERSTGDSSFLLTDTTSFDNTVAYSLTLNQPIFNFANWANVWGAQAIAKQAQATFMAAEEDLLIRTAQAYFNVLQAKDVLYYARANKESLERLLNQAKHKFDVGLTAITDLEETRANYDSAVSDEIKAINDLSNSFEQLNEITNFRYFDLDTVKADFPLISPQPNNIERWVKAAEQQNFDLVAARFAAMAARENVKVQNAGHLPVLNAQGSYSYQYDSDFNGNGVSNRAKKTFAGLGLEFPIYQGGKVISLTRQADYQYQVKLANQEQTHRSIVSNTRQTYLGILSNISKIKSDQQAIKSAQSALRATQASYTVGTRTMSDVLTSQTQLYQTQKNLAQDEYTYIVQLLKLKAFTGILDASDLKQINTWLKGPAPTTKYTTAIDKPTVEQKQPKANTKIEPKNAEPVAEPTKKIVIIPTNNKNSNV